MGKYLGHLKAAEKVGRAAGDQGKQMSPLWLRPLNSVQHPGFHQGSSGF